MALRRFLLAVAGAAAFLISPALAQVAGPSNRVITKTNLGANVSTVICPAPSAEVIRTEVFFTVSGVGIGFNGGTLTQATVGTTANTTPDWATGAANAYYLFPIPPSNAVTAYGAAGMVTCVQTLRQ